MLLVNNQSQEIYSLEKLIIILSKKFFNCKKLIKKLFININNGLAIIKIIKFIIFYLRSIYMPKIILPNIDNSS